MGWIRQLQGTPALNDTPSCRSFILCRYQVNPPHAAPPGLAQLPAELPCTAVPPLHPQLEPQAPLLLPGQPGAAAASGLPLPPLSVQYSGLMPLFVCPDCNSIKYVHWYVPVKCAEEGH